MAAAYMTSLEYEIIGPSANLAWSDRIAHIAMGRVYVVIRVFFFCGKCVYQKKLSHHVIFFCGKLCKPFTRITAKKITRLAAKKKI